MLKYFVSFVLTFSVAFSCSCGQATLVEGFDTSSNIFKGKLVKLEQVVVDSTVKRYLSEFDHLIATFEVDYCWKGDCSIQMSVATGNGGGDCGFHFELHEEYLVFANQSSEIILMETDTTLYTGICSLTCSFHSNKKISIARQRELDAFTNYIMKNYSIHYRSIPIENATIMLEDYFSHHPGWKRYNRFELVKENDENWVIEATNSFDSKAQQFEVRKRDGIVTVLR